MWDASYYYNRQMILERSLALLSEQGFDFQQFARRHREMYQRYMPETEISCRCFLSLYTYAEEDCIYLWEDEKNNCLFMLFMTAQNELRAYPPMLIEYSDERFAGAIDMYRRMFAAIGAPMCFEYATDEDVRRFRALQADVHAEAPLEEMDYIYIFDEFKDYTGGKNANRRRKYNHFIRNHQISLEQIHSENVREFRTVLDKWCAQRSCDECGHRCPRKMGLRLMHRLDELNAIGYILRVDAEAQAVILLGRMSDDMLDVLTVCATDYEMGLTETLYTLVAEEVGAEYKYMNLEEDMGIEGLRQHKQSLRPCRMQNKYTVQFQ